MMQYTTMWHIEHQGNHFFFWRLLYYDSEMKSGEVNDNWLFFFFFLSKLDVPH